LPLHAGKLGEISAFKQLYMVHITNGQYRQGGTEDDQQKMMKRQMNRRVFTLAKKLDSLVQRASVDILFRTLPPRYDVVLTVKLSEPQRRL
jgi:hypothetical protein